MENIITINPASRKRRRSSYERVFNFHCFGDVGSCHIRGNSDGPFRENIRGFLSDVADREAMDVEGRAAWRVSLQTHSQERKQRNSVSDIHVPLFIVEEDIQNSLHPHCDQCRCIGWSHHLISNRRYHFIIPSPKMGDKSLGSIAASEVVRSRICPVCRDPLNHSLSCCPTCAVEAVSGSVLDLKSHLLHGVLHCNGFGHLLCVNGRENGSEHVSGREIVDLWDRICSMLRARKVSVEDVTKKKGLELRLLHCVAYGESWFGKWGYRFGHGSFGITEQVYCKAIEAIRGMPLSVLVQHFKSLDPEQNTIATIVSRYQRLSLVTSSVSPSPSPSPSTSPSSSPSPSLLQTVGDLMRFMIEIKSKLPELELALCRSHGRLQSDTHRLQIKNANADNQQPLPRKGNNSSRISNGTGKENNISGSSVLASASFTTSNSSSSSLSSSSSSSFNSSSSWNSSNSSSSSKSSSSNSSAKNLQQLNLPNCRWSAKRLELATQVIVEALKNCEKKWMPRQDVRDAARVFIGDTGLLDFVLKSLGNRVVGDYTVRRAVNPLTKVLEYSLEETNLEPSAIARISSTSTDNTADATIPSNTSSAVTNFDLSDVKLEDQQVKNVFGKQGSSALPSSLDCAEIIRRADVHKDLVYVYKHVLESYTPAERCTKLSHALKAIPTAARIILDTKQMMKDYKGEVSRKCSYSNSTLDWGMDDDDEMLRVLCTVELKEDMELAQYVDTEDQLFDPCMVDPSELRGLIQINGSSSTFACSDRAEKLETKCHGDADHDDDESGLFDEVLEVLLGNSDDISDLINMDGHSSPTDHEAADLQTNSNGVINTTSGNDLKDDGYKYTMNQMNSASSSVLDDDSNHKISANCDIHDADGKAEIFMSGLNNMNGANNLNGIHIGRIVPTKRPNPPPELVILPPHATVGELKREAEWAFRDTFFALRGFKVESIPSLPGVDDDDLLFGNIESGSHIIIHGTSGLELEILKSCTTTATTTTTSSATNINTVRNGIDNIVNVKKHVMMMMNELRYEGGNDSWVVDCTCGAKDDDGERMIACDVCEVWQHTRCGGIADSDAIPHRYLCNKCSMGFFESMPM